MGGLVRSLGYVSATYSSAEDFLDSDRITDTSCELRIPKLRTVGRVAHNRSRRPYRLGLLKPETRNDLNAIREAVYEYLDQTVDRVA
jgi:hypothetical protein